MFGDIAEPQPVRPIRREVAADEIVMDRRPDPAGQQIRHAVRPATGSPAAAASSARNRYPNSGSSRWASIEEDKEAVLDPTVRGEQDEV